MSTIKVKIGQDRKVIPSSTSGSSDGMPIVEFSLRNEDSIYVYKPDHKFDEKIVPGCKVRFYFTNTDFDSNETTFKDFTVLEVLPKTPTSMYEGPFDYERRTVFVIDTKATIKSKDQNCDIIHDVKSCENFSPMVTITPIDVMLAYGVMKVLGESDQDLIPVYMPESFTERRKKSMAEYEAKYGPAVSIDKLFSVDTDNLSSDGIKIRKLIQIVKNYNNAAKAFASVGKDFKKSDVVEDAIKKLNDAKIDERLYSEDLDCVK